MKRILLIPILALALAGCAQLSQVSSFISTATTTITNPITPVDIYRVKNVYAATLQLAVDYRKYCWDRPYAVLIADPIAKPVCQNRRVVVRIGQAAQLKAGSAIRSADDFVTNNPTLSAATVVSAAWKAVTDFQSAVPALPK
jgi:hypothetical protein